MIFHMADGSKQEIMEATYQALSKHGYADLSIQRIADEFDKGKSLIYYHYEDKEDLMLSFIDYMLKALEASHREIMAMPQEEQLDKMLDMALGLEDDERWRFQKALLELRAQAAHDQKFAEKFREIDKVAYGKFEKILKNKGIEDEAVVEVVLSSVDGAIGRKVATNDKEGLQEMKENIKNLVDSIK